jgi:outer membrane immunogenic protein
LLPESAIYFRVKIRKRLPGNLIMKKLLFALPVIAAATGSAFAADLPARTYTKAPPPVVSPVYNWSGFYAGINGGGGSARTCWDITNNAGTPVNPAISEGCHNATGGTVGGQIGYRWQVTNWVFGVEAQGNWANFKGSNANQFAVIGGVPLLNDVTKIDSFGLFTGQVGYAFNNVLLYAKGGAAVVNDRYSTTLTPTGAAMVGVGLPGVVAGQAGTSGSETRWGGAAGVGVEFRFAPNWSVAIEYDHLFMGRQSVSQNVLPPFTAPPSTHSISQDIDMGMVRVNYTFGGPVVAKY